MLFLKILRVLYVCLAYFSICNTSNVKESSVAFFTSIFVFAFGIFCDYLNVFYIGMRKSMKFNMLLGSIGSILSLVGLILGILGLLSFLNICLIDSNLYLKSQDSFAWNIQINLKLSLKIMGIFIILAVGEFGDELVRTMNCENKEQERSISLQAE